MLYHKTKQHPTKVVIRKGWSDQVIGYYRLFKLGCSAEIEPAACVFCLSRRAFSRLFFIYFVKAQLPYLTLHRDFARHAGASACFACTAASCEAGQYLSGCGGVSAGTCAACPSGSYSSSSGMHILAVLRRDLTKISGACLEYDPVHTQANT